MKRFMFTTMQNPRAAVSDAPRVMYLTYGLYEEVSR
jgi:hypothetical protein